MLRSIPVLLAILFLTVCLSSLEGADVSSPAAYKLESGPFKVRSTKELVLSDSNRKKDLQLRINSPEGPGPFPLIVFSHGAYGSKDNYLTLTEYWASHGYVTIQANHSDSHAVGAKLGDMRVFMDWQSRPTDVSFMLDSLDEIEKKSQLEGKIDRKRIGVGGHSFGAHTSLLIGGMRVQKRGQEAAADDKRVLAVIALSPPNLERQMSEKSFEKFARPMLVMTGSEDTDGLFTQEAKLRKRPFEWSPTGDKYLVWVEGLDHGFGGIAGNPLRTKNADHVNYTKMATLAFWDAYLLESKEARAYLKSEQLPAFSKQAELKLERK